MARRGIDRATRALVDALADYDDEYLSCRNLGHYWRVVGYFKGATGITTARRLVCQRCETTRTDLWSATNGDRLAARYTYAGDYRLEGVNPSARAVRVEVMRRAVVYASEAEMLASVTNGSRRG